MPDAAYYFLCILFFTRIKFDDTSTSIISGCFHLAHCVLSHFLKVSADEMGGIYNSSACKLSILTIISIALPNRYFKQIKKVTEKFYFFSHQAQNFFLY